jgi:hypothetical protein
MIDLILTVKDTRLFHEENLQRNPKHYSFLNRNAGVDFIEKLQNNAVYFNPFVKLDGKVNKKGVWELH